MQYLYYTWRSLFSCYFRMIQVYRLSTQCVIRKHLLLWINTCIIPLHWCVTPEPSVSYEQCTFINFCPLKHNALHIFFADFWTNESSFDNNVDHILEPALQTEQWRLGLQLCWIFMPLKMLWCRELPKRAKILCCPEKKHHLIPAPWPCHVLRKSGWCRHFKTIIWTLKLTEAHPCQLKATV